MAMIPGDVEAYAEAHTTPVADHLQRLDEETRATLSSPAMLSGPVVGRLLETLVALARPQLVVEVGTFSGYSALSMAAALPEGGRIITLELSDEHADFAQRHIDASPYADRIELRRGPALAGLEAIDEHIDMVFIDADKTGYPDYYETAVRKLSPGGVLVADNTLRGGEVLDPSPSDDGTQAMARLNDRVASDDRVVGVLLTVRDGVTVVRKRQASRP
jgi:caffeoyl-CoA O-methyltransferase